MTQFIQLAIVMSLFFGSIPAAAGECMIANQPGRPISGVLSVKHATDAAGRAETAIILTPAEPQCLAASDPDDRVTNAATIHVFGGTDTVHAQLQNAIGKVVILIGNPFPAHTAHHHAPIVMDISQVVAN